MTENGPRGVTSPEQANGPHYRWGVDEGFYELYCLTVSAPASQLGVWIRYVAQSPVGRPDSLAGQLWATVFDSRPGSESFGLTRDIPGAKVTVEAEPFVLRIGEASLRNGACSGTLEGGGHTLSWALSFAASSSPYLPFPPELYDELPAGHITTFFDAFFEGWVEVDGRRVEIADAPGEQCHIWGRRHPPHGLWVHCASFVDRPDAALEILCVPESADAPDTDPLHVAILRASGSDYRQFSFLDGSVAHNEQRPGWWRFVGESETTRLEAEIRGEDTLLVEAEYHEPDGSSWWPVHHDLCSSTVRLFVRPRPGEAWRLAEQLESVATTQTEWGDWKSHPEVTAKVLRI